MKHHPTGIARNGSLKKALGFPSLFAVAIGAVTAQSSFVSLLNGTGQGGSAFLLALLLAFALTLCYCFTFLELSLMMPKAGGMGTYTAVSAGHFISIGVVLGGYVAVVPFSSPAELLLLEKIVALVYPGTFPHLGMALLLLFTALNLLGIDIFSSVQNMVVYTLLVALLVIGITGITGAKAHEPGIREIGGLLTTSGGPVLSLMVLALWSFAGLEFMCPFIEETKNPQKNLPRTMLLGAAMLLLVYGLLAIAALRNISPSTLAASETPHWLLVESLFGKSAGFVMVVFAITATSCVTNTVIAGIPRMMYGMARQGQLPAMFGRLHPRWKSPWYGIVAVFLMTAIPLVLLAGSKDFILLMLISAATFWLVAYIVAHINVMILRKRYPEYARPFSTPFYPLPQVAGILGMGIAIWYNSPSPELSRQVYLNSALMFILISGYAFFWVKYKMRKGVLETEPIDEALSE